MRADPKKKRRKENPQKTIQIKPKQIEQIKRQIAKEATERACLVMLAAVGDTLGLTEEQLCKVMECTDLYASHIDNHLVKLEDIRKAIEKNTGIVLTGWK